MAHFAVWPVWSKPLAARRALTRAQVVHRAEPVSAYRVAQKKGAHPESGSPVIPPGVKPAGAGPLRYGGVKQVDRVAGLDPVADQPGRDRFRNELGAAFPAAVAAIAGLPARQAGSDPVDIQNRGQTMICLEECGKVLPRPG